MPCSDRANTLTATTGLLIKPRLPSQAAASEAVHCYAAHALGLDSTTCCVRLLLCVPAAADCCARRCYCLYVAICNMLLATPGCVWANFESAKLACIVPKQTLL